MGDGGMTKLYLIRHAEAEGNLYRIAHGHCNGLITNYRGYQQIDALRERFRDVDIDAVYSSDLYRTQITARAIWLPKSLPLQLEPAFREICMGPWEDHTWHELNVKYPEEMYNFNRRADLWRVPGAETAQQVVDRFIPALERVARRHEGGAVAADAPLGVAEPVAMVGVSEKGHVDLTVTARADGGHASTPAANDACRLLARVCERISANPGKPVLTPAVEATLSELGARSGALYKAVFGNLWLTRPLVTKIMAGVPETGAMIRTTYALTQMEGSTAHNVLPPVARANFNVRVAPFETIDDAVARARVLAAQECEASGLTPDHVTVEVNEAIPYTEPAPVSPFAHDAAFDYIHRCVAGVYPEAGFAPYVQNSCTDSREFNAICERVYRFCGFVYSGEARTLLHAPNERIGVDVYKRGIEFYVAFLGHLADL